MSCYDCQKPTTTTRMIAGCSEAMCDACAKSLDTVRVLEPTPDVDEESGALRRYDDASYIRPATREERAESLRAEQEEPGATGVIVVDGVRCYVD